MALELRARLRALADWVEPGCRCLADIGTDHGYIPAALRKRRPEGAPPASLEVNLPP